MQTLSEKLATHRLTESQRHSSSSDRPRLMARDGTITPSAADSRVGRSPPKPAGRSRDAIGEDEVTTQHGMSCASRKGAAATCTLCISASEMVTLMTQVHSHQSQGFHTNYPLSEIWPTTQLV